MHASIVSSGQFNTLVECSKPYSTGPENMAIMREEYLRLRNQQAVQKNAL